MPALAQSRSTPDQVLAKAVLRAAEQLRLSQSALADVLGVHRTTITQLKKNLKLDPNSKQGELALLLIRLARALFALTGGDQLWIQHFMRTPNRATGGVPAEQVTRLEGLFAVLRFVDGMRGKV
ncbi:MbcA/ParS/Xre antitoxin family protein [Halomonas sp. BMC6]|uniref:MbcA/ParS/Xre antitoxin family protein n=1 Tax=Halomonas sp. BMC6 TaxID=3073244 RepID=UPI0030CBB879